MPDRLGYTGDGKKIHAFNEEGDPICGQLRKKTVNGEPTYCQSQSTFMNGRCRVHGGGKLAGPMHSSFKHGKYSKAVSSKYLQRYTEYRENDDFISLKDEIALNDTRTDELLTHLENGDPDSKSMEKLQKFCTQAESYTGMVENDTFDSLPRDVKRELEMLRSALAGITDVVAKGANENIIWKEIQVNHEMRRRLSETEQKRVVSNQQMIRSEDALNMFYEIQTIFSKHVRPLEGGNSALERVSRDLERIVAMPRRAEGALGGIGAIGVDADPIR